MCHTLELFEFVLPPDANVLILVGEMEAPIEVEGLNHPSAVIRIKKPLGAAGRSQVIKTTGQLGHLKPERLFIAKK